MHNYKDLHYQGSDGIQLYARDYNSAAFPSEPAILCLHGLTRNSADFEDIASHLAQRYRVLVPEQRGRGSSAWDENTENYQPATYVADTFCLLDELGIERVIILGTSMGGLMAMMMSASRPQAIAGVILNDVGPEIDPAGLARIKGYVGKTAPVGNWEDAAATVKELNQTAFPDYSAEEWEKMAQQLYREDQQGTPVLAYDPAISRPIAADNSAAVPPNLWPLFETLENTPTLALRGALSDILSRQCFEKMQQKLPRMSAITVPGRGHAPALNEPAAMRAIDDFLDSLTGGSA